MTVAQRNIVRLMGGLLAVVSSVMDEDTRDESPDTAGDQQKFRSERHATRLLLRLLSSFLPDNVDFETNLSPYRRSWQTTMLDFALTDED